MKEKVVVGMSGGVDSSVAAYLLKKQGYDVIGVTMQIWQDEENEVQEENGGCCGLSAVDDARRVASSIGIPYYVMNFKQEFQKNVIDYFTKEYLNGRTPNPCIACNRYVKWEALLQRSLSIGADYIATGHYARIDKLPNGRYAIRRSATLAKDQTYALYNLTQEQLDALAQFDTPTICNAIEGFGVRGRTEGFTRPELRMRAAMSDKPMVGYARTGVISARQPATPAHSAVMEAYYRQYEDFDLPMVAAIQDLDRVPVGSFWGDVQATVHRALGCIGVITDGGVRDIEEVKRVGFYLFSKEVLISHAYIHMVEAGTAVDICGMTVRPGDLIHADAHGAIVIPQEIAGQLAEACVRAMDAEEALKGPCQAAIARGERVTAKEIMAWRGEMQRRRAAIAPKQEHL